MVIDYEKKNKPVIPGFGLSMGITISILSLVVLIPLASLVIYTAQMSFKDFIETITRARVLASFYTSFHICFCSSSDQWDYGDYPRMGTCKI